MTIETYATAIGFKAVVKDKGETLYEVEGKSPQEALHRAEGWIRENHR